MFNNNVYPGGGKESHFFNVKFCIPQPYMLRQKLYTPLKWYTPPKVKNKTPYYVFLWCFKLFWYMGFRPFFSRKTGL